MFSKDITGSDAFREMPTSSQALYFHLGMEADDDGFLDSYKGLMRSISASDDDLKVLVSKRFLIVFPTNILVVKHWLINNAIRKDRYTETKYLEEKRALKVKENKAYTESGNQVATKWQPSIVKDSKEKDTVAEVNSAPVIESKTTVPSKEGVKLKDTPISRAVAEWEKLYLRKHGVKPVVSWGKAGSAIKRAMNLNFSEDDIYWIFHDFLKDEKRVEWQSINMALSEGRLNKWRSKN